MGLTRQVLLRPETTLKGPIYYRIVNLTILFSWESQANKLASSANKMSSASFDTLFISFINNKKNRAQDGSLGDITTDRLWRGAVIVKLNKLQPVWEVVPNPVHGHAMDTIVFEIVKKDIMINSIKRLRESKENANGNVHCGQEQEISFHIGQSMLKIVLETLWNTLCRMLDIIFQTKWF